MHNKKYFENLENYQECSNQIEVLILVTHGILVQSLPTLFEGRNGYANYCACSCIEFAWENESEIGGGEVVTPS